MNQNQRPWRPSMLVGESSVYGQVRMIFLEKLTLQIGRKFVFEGAWFCRESNVNIVRANFI